MSDRREPLAVSLPTSRAASFAGQHGGEASVQLPMGHWWRPNHRALSAFIAHAQRADAPVLCAFDWDNTCVFGDIGDVTFAYQLDALRLPQSPSALAALWQPIAHGVAARAQSAVARQAAAAAITWLNDALAAWAVLHPWLVGDDGPAIRAQQAEPVAHAAFRCKMLSAMRALLEAADEAGIAATFAAVAQLWPHTGGASLRREIEAVLRFNDTLGAAGAWYTEAGVWGGALSTAVPSPVAPLPEMQALVQALSTCRALPAVVSASPEPVVREVARQWRYQVAPQHVVGMPIAPGGTSAITYRAGKVDAIAQRFGRAPQLVAGDAPTDYEMLTGFADTRLRLIIERLPASPLMAALAAQPFCGDGAPAFVAGEVTTLAQARNEATLCFAPVPPQALAQKTTAPGGD